MLSRCKRSLGAAACSSSFRLRFSESWMRSNSRPRLTNSFLCVTTFCKDVSILATSHVYVCVYVCVCVCVCFAGFYFMYRIFAISGCVYICHRGIVGQKSFTLTHTHTTTTHISHTHAHIYFPVDRGRFVCPHDVGSVQSFRHTHPQGSRSLRSPSLVSLSRRWLQSP